MKFVCDRCHTKYSIADEKVRQKILKIRCKTCENVITVRDSMAQESETGASGARPVPPPPPARVPARAVEWHLAVNGRQEGPFGLSALAKRLESVGKTDEAYVWNENLDGWKEPKDVPEVAAEMSRARPAPPPPPARKPSLGGAPAVGASRLPSPSGARPVVGGSSPGLARKSSSMPVATARPSGTRPVATGTPTAGAYGFEGEGQGEEEKTQIQPLDASMMSLDAGKAGAKPANGARPSGAMTSAPDALELDMDDTGAKSASEPPSSGLEGLDFGRKAAAGASLFSAPAATAPAPQPTGASQLANLSQLHGLPGFFGRHPAFKYLATGGVLVALVIVVAVVYMTSDSQRQRGDGPKVASASAAPAQQTDLEAQARAEAEARFRTTVGGNDPAPASARNIGPTASRRPTPPPRGGKPAAAKASGPPPVAPPPVSATEPPPVQPIDGANVAKRFGDTERRVELPVRREASSGGKNVAFNEAEVKAVVQKNRPQLKICYDRALKRDNKLTGGKIEITVYVGPSGTVKSVSVAAPPEFGLMSTCLKDAVKRWHFPRNDAEYEVPFTTVLQGSAG